MQKDTTTAEKDPADKDENGTRPHLYPDPHNIATINQNNNHQT